MTLPFLFHFVYHVKEAPFPGGLAKDNTVFRIPAFGEPASSSFFSNYSFCLIEPHPIPGHTNCRDFGLLNKLIVLCLQMVGILGLFLFINT